MASPTLKRKMTSALTRAKPKQTTFRIGAVLICTLALAAAAVVYAGFEIQPGAAISQTNEAAVIRVTAVGRDDLYDTASQGNLNFHVKVRGSCDDGWKVGSATLKIKGKIHHLDVNKSLGSIGFDNGKKWSFQVATFPYLPPDTKSSPVAMCNAELERRLARGDSKAEVLSKGFDLTAPHAYFAELSVACLRKKGFLESYHPYAETKLPVTISCQQTGYKAERTPGAPKRTPGAPKRTPPLPGRLPVPEPEKAGSAGLPTPQLEFTGKESYETNGTRWTRYKLSVTNRANLPDFLWNPVANLPPCGKNENASRTWVETFGSPGDERLNGFCGLRSSEDLNQLWFAIPAGEKGPPCVYIVMTDRQTRMKYISNRVCSRSFTVATGGFNAGGQTQQIQKGKEQWIELNSTQINESTANTSGGTGRDSIATFGSGNTPKAAQPDLSISQFLFPPTNDKALRVRVVNMGQGPSAACRLVITIRKINGVAVGRTTHVNVPALAIGADDWLHIDVNSILPKNVSLKSTTFRLSVDATEIVGESNESNNEVWHNQ